MARCVLDDLRWYLIELIFEEVKCTVLRAVYRTGYHLYTKLSLVADVQIHMHALCSEVL